MKKLAGEENVPADHQPETVSRGGGAAPTSATDQENHHHIVEGQTSSNPILLDDDVDTTSGISTAVSVSRSSEISPRDQTSSSDQEAYLETTPAGIQWLRQQLNFGDPPPEKKSARKSINWGKKGPPAAAADRQAAEASASASAAGDENERRHGGDDDEDRPQPLVPIEKIGGLLRAVESRGGSRPEFLYRKKLVGSDVSKDQHRVFLCGGEGVMKFLREEEAVAVNGGGNGLTIVGVDGGGRVYENLALTKWQSVSNGMIVIKADWVKVVDANKVKKNHVMEIWGYRENDKPCLAFNFFREREERDGDGDEGDNVDHAASTSSSNPDINGDKK